MKILFVALALSTVNAAETVTKAPVVDTLVGPLEHRGCFDDSSYNSPIAPNTPCDFFKHANCECSAWIALLTLNELQELYTNCPDSCDVSCDYVVPNLPTISPTLPGPTASPTKAPDTCIDDPAYLFPINPKYGCDIYAHSPLTCQQFGLAMTPAQAQEAIDRCPISCDVPCGDNTPTASPTVCEDDESYISPINPKYGCKLYCETDCNKFVTLLVGTEVQDMFSSCPLSCGLCG
jgi:hypothetical protein